MFVNAGSRNLYLHASIGSIAQEPSNFLQSPSQSSSLACVLGSIASSAPLSPATYGTIQCGGQAQSGFHMHPAALDACLQLGATVPSTAVSRSKRTVFVPAGFQVGSLIYGANGC